MPWPNVDALKSSDFYKRMKTMNSWSSDQLAKFIATFDAVFSKAKSEGADDAEAESVAIPIAMGTAKRMAHASFAANLEETRHYFVPMWHHQLGQNSSSGLMGDSYSFRMMQKFWEPLRQSVAGITFNHEHDQSSPVGVIHDLLTRDQAASMGLPVASDAPFVVVASYMKDVGPAVRDETRISAEWLTYKASDGKSEAIPISFAVTDTPLNGEILGVKRIASLTAAQQIAVPAAIAEVKAPVEIRASASTPIGASSMPDPTTIPTDPEVRIASLNAKVEEATERARKAELNAAAWKGEFESAKRTVEELKASATQKQAEDAAMGLVRAGKATADQANYFASLCLKIGLEEFERLAAGLQVSSLGSHGIRAAASNLIVSEGDVKAYKERMAKLLRE